MAVDPTGLVARRVTVIVPVKDDLTGLRRCLEHLARQDHPADLVEVFVCDNGSVPAVRDADIEDVAPVGTVLLHEPAAGSYRARNRCLRAATGDVLAFTDADCSPAADWLTRGLSALGPRSALTAGRVVVYPAGPVPSPVEAFEMLSAFPQERYVQRMGFGVTANLFVTADVFSRTGPFDERLSSGGDREYCTRATGKGASLGYAADSVVRHPARASLTEITVKARRVRRGRYVELGVAPDRKQILRRLMPPLGAVRRSRGMGTSVSLRARYVVGEFLAHYAVSAVEVPYLWRSRSVEDKP